MGLIYVELIMACEEEFGIEIEDEESERIVSPGNLVDLFYEKTSLINESVCQSQRAFYAIRKTLAEYAGVERKSISPETRLDRLIEPDAAREIWSRLEDSIPTITRRWPSLNRPVWADFLCWGGMTTGLCGIVISWIATFFVNKSALLAVLLLGSFCLFVWYFTESLRTIVPSELTEIRHLVPYAVNPNYKRYSREQVAEKIKMLICEYLDVKENVYGEHLEFNKDI